MSSTNVRNKLIQQELAKRLEQQKAPKFQVEKFCFDKQLEFIKSPGRFKVACTSTRAGKTNALIAHMISTCQAEHDVIVGYFTISANSARNIIWGELKRILEDYKVPVNVNETTMRIKFLETRSEIRISGANNETEVEKVRGWKMRAVYIDEAQSFKNYLAYFVKDVLMARLRDYKKAEIFLTGTPGPVPAGYFYDIYHDKNSWEKFHWTAFDNPHMENLEQILAEERAAFGIDENDPGYRREVYGEWVQDTNSLVFCFNKELNTTTKIPDNLEFIFGVDLGYVDSDAISVIGYNNDGVYLVEEKITSKQTISDLAEQIKKLNDFYRPTKIIYDGGALGKKIGQELLQRHGLNMHPAEKDRKLEFIELLNDDLRTGRFKAFPNSCFEQDCAMILWDKSSNAKRTISDKFHSDCADSTLYAWREAKHFIQLPTPTVPPERRSYEADQERIKKESEALDAKLRGELDEDIISDQDLEAVFDVYGSDWF